MSAKCPSRYPVAKAVVSAGAGLTSIRHSYQRHRKREQYKMSINARVSRLREWMEHGYARPYMVEHRLTQRCNLRCRFCPGRMWKFDYDAELNQEQLLQAVHDAAELGVKRWIIVGDGEPGCRLQDCLAVMRAVKEHDIFGTMTTNGTLFTEEAIREIVRTGWDHLAISLDGPNAEIHDYLRGVPGVFDRVMLTIDRFNKAKQEYGAQSPVWDFQFVMNSKNYTTLSDMIGLAAEKQVQNVTFQPLIYHQGTDRSLILSASQKKALKASIPVALREAERLGVMTNLQAYLDTPLIENTDSMQNVLLNDEDMEEHPLLGYPCFEPWYFIAIRADGGVDPCWHVREDPKSNIKNASLKEIWTGQYFTNFRKCIREGKMFEECKKCCAVGVIENKKMKDWLRGDLYAIRSQGYENTIKPL